MAELLDEGVRVPASAVELEGEVKVLLLHAGKEPVDLAAVFRLAVFLLSHARGDRDHDDAVDERSTAFQKLLVPGTFEVGDLRGGICAAQAVERRQAEQEVSEGIGPQDIDLPHSFHRLFFRA